MMLRARYLKENTVFQTRSVSSCSGLTLVMQEIQSAGNLLHDHTGFLLAEVASLVNVGQD